MIRYNLLYYGRKRYFFCSLWFNLLKKKEMINIKVSTVNWRISRNNISIINNVLVLEVLTLLKTDAVLQVFKAD